MSFDMQVGGRHVTRKEAQERFPDLVYSEAMPFKNGLFVQFVSVGSSMKGDLFYLNTVVLISPLTPEYYPYRVSCERDRDAWKGQPIWSGIPLNGGLVYPTRPNELLSVHPDDAIWTGTKIGTGYDR